MIKISVTAPFLAISPLERLVLTPDQAKVRAHNLKPLGGGVYEALAALQFKCGETLEIEAVQKPDMMRVKILSEVHAADAPMPIMPGIERPKPGVSKPGRPGGGR